MWKVWLWAKYFFLCYFWLSTRICLSFTISSEPGVCSFGELHLSIAFLFLIVINLGNLKKRMLFGAHKSTVREPKTQFKSFIIRKWMAWMHLYLLTFKGKWIMEWNLKSGINVCALTRQFIVFIPVASAIDSESIEPLSVLHSKLEFEW